MPQMLEKLQFSICSLGKDWRAEWFHDLLHRDSLTCQLVFGGAERIPRSAWGLVEGAGHVPNETEGTHANGL